MKFRASLSGIILSIFLLLLCCAKIEYPPGGPEDKTPPEILSSVPQANQREVARDSEIRIEFSEKINGADIIQQVYIVPDPEEPPVIKVKGKTLVIEFKDSLQADQTYLISLKTGLADLHNNRLVGPFKLAFSTGDKIDKGKISGIVYKNFKPAVNTDVWAFRTDTIVSIFDIKPNYITQTNDSGLYQLEYLQTGKYLCLAVEDMRSDRKYDPGADLIGLPTGEVVLDSIKSAVFNFNFDLSKQDSSSLKLISARYNEDKLIMLKFSSTIDINKISPENIEIAGDDGIVLDSFKIFSTSDTTDNIFIHPNVLPASDSLHVFVKDLISLNNRPLSDSLNNMYIQIDTLTDTNPPKLISFYPADNSRSFPADSGIRLNFSEMIETDSAILNTIELAGNDSLDYTDFSYAVNLNRLSIELLDSLVAGQTYTFSIDLSQVHDASGNAVDDSVRQIRFTVVRIDDFGSVSGQLQNGMGGFSDPVIFVRSVSGNISELVAVDTSYHFKHNLPTGSYQFYGFDDINMNRLYDRGSILPLEFAEPFILFPDTVSVRSRFETEEIILKIPR